MASTLLYTSIPQTSSFSKSTKLPFVRNPSCKPSIVTLPRRHSLYRSNQLRCTSNGAPHPSCTPIILTTLPRRYPLNRSNQLRYTNNAANLRGLACTCFSNTPEEYDKKVSQESKLGWPILRRWDVPWNWQTISLTSLACVVSGSTSAYLDLAIKESSLTQKAQILFGTQAIFTVVVLAFLYGMAKSFKLPDDIYRYDWRDPFDLQGGWLLWAGIGAIGVFTVTLATVAALIFFGVGLSPRKVDSLNSFLTLIGSSNISMAWVVGIAGVLGPIFQETVFRGFFMVSLTKWLPTPLAVLVAAAVTALIRLDPITFLPDVVLGLSYAQTHNLLTPITIIAFFNWGAILLVTFLRLKGYKIILHL